MRPRHVDERGTCRARAYARGRWTALVTALAEQGPRRRYAAGDRRQRAPDTSLQACALRARVTMQLAAGIEPAASWQAPQGELAAPIQHNGRLLSTAAVARRARLVRQRCAPCGLRAIPVMSCAPRRLRARSAGSRGVARSPRAEHHARCGIGQGRSRKHLASAPAARAPRTQRPPTPGRAMRSGSPSSPPRCARPSPQTATRGFAALADSQRLRAKAHPGRRVCVGQNVPLGKNSLTQGEPSSS